MLVGFEILETARALPMLKKEGKVVVNMKHIQPSCSISGVKPKKTGELMNILRSRAIVHEVDGVRIAEKLGNILVVNTVLLGALSALPEIPVKQEAFKQAIAGRIKEKYVNLNLKKAPYASVMALVSIPFPPRRLFKFLLPVVI